MRRETLSKGGTALLSSCILFMGILIIGIILFTLCYLIEEMLGFNAILLSLCALVAGAVMRGRISDALLGIGSVSLVIHPLVIGLLGISAISLVLCALVAGAVIKGRRMSGALLGISSISLVLCALFAGVPGIGIILLILCALMIRRRKALPLRAMMREREVISILVGSATILLILCSFNLYSISDEGRMFIAERKARELFFWRNLPLSIYPYIVTIQKRNIPFFKYHSLYATSGSIMGSIPLVPNAVIAVGGDGRVFVFPDDFNVVIMREKVEVDSEKRALEVIAVYLNSSVVYGYVKLLYNASDIPGFHLENETEQQRLRSTITPPNISSYHDGYLIEFFSWRALGGDVERWIVKVERNGTINVLERKKIASVNGFFLQ